jgi:hypothetical protein
MLALKLHDNKPLLTAAPSDLTGLEEDLVDCSSLLREGADMLL